jgi:hypothetical protein
MSKTRNLRRRAKIILVATIGTTHKTNSPCHFIDQFRDIIRSMRRIATIGRSPPHSPSRKNEHIAKSSMIRPTTATGLTRAAKLTRRAEHRSGTNLVPGRAAVHSQGQLPRERSPPVVQQSVPAPERQQQMAKRICPWNTRHRQHHNPASDSERRSSTVYDADNRPRHQPAVLQLQCRISLLTYAVRAQTSTV